MHEWRKNWLAALTSWHSPYKALVDLTPVQIEGEKVPAALQQMFKHLSALFLKKAAGFGASSKDLFPFPVFATEEEACTELGIREGSGAMGRTDFRGLITFENFFKQHVMELSF